MYIVQVLLWSDHSFAGEMIWRWSICTIVWIMDIEQPQLATFAHVYIGHWTTTYVVHLLPFVPHRQFVMTLMLKTGPEIICSWTNPTSIDILLLFLILHHLPSSTSHFFSTSSNWSINVHPLGRPMPVPLILIWQKFSHWQPSWPETFFLANSCGGTSVSVNDHLLFQFLLFETMQILHEMPLVEWNLMFKNHWVVVLG